MEDIKEIFIETICKDNGIVFSYIINLHSNAIIEKFPSPFFTAILWEEITRLKIDVPLEMQNNAIDFLLKSRKNTTGWGFFTDQRGYPTDSDDTSTIGGFLASVNKLQNIDKISSLLINNLKTEDSFFVWLIENGIQRHSEVNDPIVDLNTWSFIKKYSKFKKINLPSAIKIWISNLRNIPDSPYYPDPVVNFWFLLRSNFFTKSMINKKSFFNVSEYWKKSYPNFNKVLLKYLYKLWEISDQTKLSNYINDKDLHSIWFRHISCEKGYSCPLLQYMLASLFNSL